MKKRFTILCVVVVILSFLNFLPVSGAEADVLKEIPANETVNVLSENELNPKRFENMLNNNYVFGDAFNTYEGIVLGSQLSLLNKAENGKLKNSDLNVFVENMYGINLADIAKTENEKFDLKGKTEVVPRGYTKYKHTFIKSEENADGTVTVYTSVIEEHHDSENESKNAVSVFVKNEKSAFGYNLFSCEIIVE